MQKRERLLAGAVALLLGGWLLDSVVIEPALAWFAGMDKQTVAARQEIGEAKALIDRQARILSDWRARHAAGLLDDEDQARFRLQRTLQGAAQDGGFTIGAVSAGQLIPANQDQVYDLLRLTVSGHGTLAQVQAFAAALETAAMPLCIERSEWSAGDARKDHLDVALTLSTRLVSAKARSGRAVPAGTVAWTPAARSPALDAEVAQAKPFQADRHSSRHEVAAEREPRSETAVEATPERRKGWALVGIAAGGDQAVAFVRHQSDGSERQLRAGDTIDGLSVLAVAPGGLRLQGEAGETAVAVGQDLTGNDTSGAFAAPPAGSVATSGGTGGRNGGSAVTVPAGAAAAPFQVPTVGSDPARDAVLQRLRERRNRAP